MARSEPVDEYDHSHLLDNNAFLIFSKKKALLFFEHKIWINNSKISVNSVKMCDVPGCVYSSAYPYKWSQH